MRRCRLLGTLLWSIALIWSYPVEAAIVEIYGRSSLPSTEYPPWVFDHELQELTITGNVHFPPGSSNYIGAYLEPWGNALICDGGSIGIIRGAADSDSVFPMTGVFKNETGIAWTAWVIGWNAPFAFDSIPLEDVDYVGGSKLTNAIYPSDSAILLTGDPVLPGEAFTIELDIRVAEGGFYDRLHMGPIPEPITVVLLGLGSLGLMRTGPSRRVN